MKQPKPILVLKFEMYLMEEEREMINEQVKPISEDYHILIMENQEQEKDLDLQILSTEKLTEQTRKNLEKKIKKLTDLLDGEN